MERVREITSTVVLTQPGGNGGFLFSKKASREEYD